MSVFLKIAVLVCLCSVLYCRPHHRRKHRDRDKSDEEEEPRPVNRLDEDMLLFWKDTKAPPCTPFSAFMMNCNKCVCATDRTLSCTRLKCAPNGEPELLKFQKDTNEEYNENKPY